MANYGMRRSALASSVTPLIATAKRCNCNLSSRGTFMRRLPLLLSLWETDLKPGKAAQVARTDPEVAREPVEATRGAQDDMHAVIERYAP